MSAELPKILIVDDRPENLYALEKLLKSLPVKVIQASSGEDALKCSLEQEFCLAIVDIQMPGMDGYELVELLRSNEGTHTMPIIFVSAIFSDEYHHQKAYEAGAVDFLSKPFAPEILLSKIKVFIELYQQRNTERKRRQLAESLEYMGRSLAGMLNFQESPRHILDQLFALIPYDHGMVLYREENTLTGMALRGFSVESAAQLTLPIRSGSVYYQITASRSPLMLDDVTRHSDWQQAEFLHKDRSWIGVPLLVRNQVTGILTLSRQTAGQFSSEDMMLAWAYAGQAAVALENARLYHELSTLNNDLEKLVSLRTQELEKANLALERADKIKSDFITVAAHEMRTPLTLIKGYTDLLKTQFADNADASKLLQGIESGEARMLDVVTSMLDISKIENQVLQVSKEPVIFRDVVSDIQQVFEKALQERKIQVDRRALDTLPPLWADPELLHKLIYQLMSNAIKYTPDGGTITLRGQMIPATESTTQKAMTEIVIQDTGIGINPEYHEQIFEKFFQTGQVKLHSTSRTNFKGGGPGLGLTIARGIVLAHGGRIWVESPGYDETTCPGSAFHILLPNE